MLAGAARQHSPEEIVDAGARFGHACAPNTIPGLARHELRVDIYPRNEGPSGSLSLTKGVGMPGQTP